VSVPRVMLAPTHRTGLANAIAAAAAEITTAQGSRARYHHLGPLSPASCWDRWEGTVFLDPALCGDERLFGLYDLTTRGADLSLLSCSAGLLDHRDGVSWVPADLARRLDCPVVVVLDCRAWGTGLRLLLGGLRALTPELNLAGAIVTGVADRNHYEVLRHVLSDERLLMVGCLYEAEGVGWDIRPPGAWGLPLDPLLLDAIARQVDIKGLASLAGQRGFLSPQSWSTDRKVGGPVIAVAGGRGFTPWSRESIELLRLAGAQVVRLDLIEDGSLPSDVAGLVLAGTLWPDTIADIALNTDLLREIAVRIDAGLPTLALGGGMLILLQELQDSLGRSSELAGVLPARGEILWDFDEPAYVAITSRRDNLLFARGESALGWVLTDAEIGTTAGGWDSPLSIKGGGVFSEWGEGVGTDSLLCSPAFVHLAGSRDSALRFVRRCAAYSARNA